MKRRFVAFLLAAVMVLGMVPFAAAAPVTTVLTGHPAAFEYAVTVDGAISETGYAMSGVLSGGENTGRFGFVWDRDNLYLALEPQEGKLALTVNGVEVAVDGLEAASGAVYELKIPMALIGLYVEELGMEVPASIAYGDLAWEGNVVLDPTIKTPISLSGKGIVGTAENLGYSGSGNDYHMWNKYNPNATNAASNTKGGRVYASGNNSNLGTTSQILIAEFDFSATAMPVVEPAKIQPTFACYGANFVMVTTNSNGFSAGIANTAEGLVYVLNSGKYSGEFATAALNKQLGDSFHIRQEYEPGGDLYVYVDDVLLQTFKTPGTDARAWGTNVQNLLQVNLYEGDTKNGLSMADSTNDLDFSIENLVLGLKAVDVSLDNLTFASFKGDNTSMDAIRTNLDLPAIAPHSMINGLALQWTSSNPAVISNDGVVTVPDVNTEVTMTASLVKYPDVTKSFTLTVLTDAVMASASLAPVTVDGILNDTVWMLPDLAAKLAETEGDVTGTAYAVYGGGFLHVAAQYENAASMELTVGARSWSFDLAASIEETALTGAAADGVVELQIDLAEAGIYVNNYGEAVTYQVKLIGENGSAALFAESGRLCFSGSEVSDYMQWPTLPSYGMIHKKVTRELDDSGNVTAYKMDDPKERLYVAYGGTSSNYNVLPNLLWDKGALWEVELNVSRMNDSTGQYISLYQNPGATIVMHDGNNSSSIGSAGILWNNNGTLTFNIIDATDVVRPVALDVGLNETFQLGIRWNIDHSVTVYVNGVEKGTVANARRNNSPAGNKDAFVVNTAGDTCMTVTGLDFSFYGVLSDVSEEITVNSVFGDTDLTAVTANLPLSDTVWSDYLGQVPVRWESSDDRVITAFGEITRGEEDATATLTLYLGESTEALWSVDVTVKALDTLFGASMTLGNDLSMNFIIEQSKVLQSAFARIRFQGDYVDIIKDDWTANGEMYCISYAGIAAKEMSDQVLVRICDMDGNPLTTMWEDSIRSYAMRMLEKENPDQLKTALVDMLNYGAAAQEFFGYNTEDLANSLLTDEQKALATAEVTLEDKRVAAEGYVGSSLELESNIVLKFFFEESFAGKTATVTYTDHYGNEVSYEIDAVANGNLAVVPVDRLVVADASVLVTVAIDGIEVTDSVASYCCRMNEQLPLALPLMKFATSAYAQLHAEN